MKHFVRTNWSTFFGSIELSIQESLGNSECRFERSLVYLRFHAPQAKCSIGSDRQCFVASGATEANVVHPAAIDQQFQAQISIALDEDLDPYFQPKFDCSFRYRTHEHFDLPARTLANILANLLAKILPDILADLHAAESLRYWFGSPSLAKPPHSTSFATCTCQTGRRFPSFV